MAFVAVDNRQVSVARFDDPDNLVLSTPNSRLVAITVFNAQIRYQFIVGGAGASTVLGSWVPPNGGTLPPGLWNFGEKDFGGMYCHAVRICAVDALAPTPAVVSVSSA